MLILARSLPHPDCGKQIRLELDLPGSFLAVGASHSHSDGGDNAHAYASVIAVAVVSCGVTPLPVTIVGLMAPT